jgi:hypothetical protein
MTIDRDDLDQPSYPRATEPVPEPLPSAQRRREELREQLRREGLFYSRDSLEDLKRLFETRVPLGAADLEILQLACRVRPSDVSQYLNDIASAGAESDYDMDQSYVSHGPHGGDFDLPF